MLDDYDVLKGEPVNENFLILSVTKECTHLDTTGFLFKELLLSRSTVKDAEATLNFMDDEYGALLGVACDLADWIRIKQPNHPLIRKFEALLNGTDKKVDGDDDEKVSAS